MTDRPLLLRVFDVGHGDSLLLEHPDGEHFAIVDCHRQTRAQRPSALRHLLEKHKEAPGRVIVSFAVLTHPDADHVRGYGDLLRGLREAGISVEQFWNSAITDRWLEALAEHLFRRDDELDARDLAQLVGEVERLTDGRKHDYRTLESRPVQEAYVWENSVSIEFLAPNPCFTVARALRECVKDASARRRLGRIAGPGTDLNLTSACLRVRFGDVKVLLAGDMMNQAWEVLLYEERLHDARSHVLKVPHHGSLHSNFPRREPLCNHVQIPGNRLTAVVSGGYLEGLPHPDTLQSLSDYGCDAYLTGAGHSFKPVPFLDPLLDSSTLDKLRSAGALVEELVPEYRPACGDICVECFSNGRVNVVSQFARRDNR